MSKSHVLSNPAIPFKKGLNHDLTRAALAFENPENTYSVSKFQTGCGVVDIMMHTMERYYTIEPDNELTDRLAEALLLSVKNAGAVAVKDPTNYEARATLMWASSLSHNDLLGCGKNVVAFTVHPLSHAVSAMFDNVSHGAALSVLYPAWAKFIYKHDVRKFCQSATRIWGIPMNFDHPEETALLGIEAMKSYFHSIDMPVTMQELGIGPEHYEALADLITDNGKKPVWSYEPLTKEVIIEIFKLAE